MGNTLDTDVLVSYTIFTFLLSHVNLTQQHYADHIFSQKGSPCFKKEAHFQYPSQEHYREADEGVS